MGKTIPMHLLDKIAGILSEKNSAAQTLLVRLGYHNLLL